MSWNEQGGDKDPWGGRKGDQAPPDIDEALKRLKEKVTAFTGKRGGGRGLVLVAEWEVPKTYCRSYYLDC